MARSSAEKEHGLAAEVAMMELMRLPDAARELGISYPALKQWIYRRKIRSIRTPGGHHRIPRAEIDRLLFDAERARSGRSAPAGSPGPRWKSGLGPRSGLEYLISGRNQLVGRVTSLTSVGLLAKVTLDVGGQTVTAIITRDASKELGLRVGDVAAALIKATEVMIIHASPQPSERQPTRGAKRKARRQAAT
jgi:molybdopterin-binding protein